MTSHPQLRVLGSFRLAGAPVLGLQSLAVRVVQAAALAGPLGVTASQLGEAIWSDRMPPTWKSSLRTHIAGARAMLLQHTESLRLELVQSRYVLAGDISLTDVGLLRSSPSDGVVHDGEGRNQWLRRVADLVVEPMLPEPKAPWQLTTYRELVTLHQNCLIEWAAGPDLLQPTPDQIDALERAVRLNPDQQELAASLLKALIRLGRVGQAEALAATTRDAVADRGHGVRGELQDALRLLRCVRHDRTPSTSHVPPFLQVQRRHVGRRDELAAVVSLLATRRSNKVVVVEGDAGLGKTQFLAKLAELAGDQSLLAAQAIPQSGPLRLIEQLFSRDSTGALEGDEAPAAFIDLVGRAHDVPILVLIDNLHESDLASVKVLRRLLDDPLPESTTLILSTRPAEGPAFVGRFLDDVRNRRDTIRIQLAPMSLIEISELVADRRLDTQTEGDGVSGAFANQLLRASGGSPLLADLLLERNLDLDAVASDVARTVQVDVEQLGPDTQRVVGYAAVFGREFPVAIVAEAARLSIARTSDALAEAERAGVLAPRVGSSGRFRHELVRTVVRSLLPATQRAELHQRLAEVLEVRGQPLLSVVHQAEGLIDAGDMDDALVVLDRIVSLQVGLHWDISLEALDAFERATRDQPWLLSEQQRATVALLRGKACQASESWTDGRAAFRRAFEIASAHGFDAVVIDVALSSGGSNVPLDGDAERRGWLVAALGIAEPTSEARTRCLSELVHSVHFEGLEPSFEPYVHELEALDATNTDPFNSGLIHHGLLVVNMGYPPRSSGRFDRAVRAREVADSSTPEASGTSALVLASCLLAEGDFGSARQALVDFTASARRVDRVGDKWVQLVCETVFAEWLGDVASADRFASAALELATRYALPEGLMTFAAFRIGRALRDGDWGVIDQVVDPDGPTEHSPGEASLAARLSVQRRTGNGEALFWRAESMLRGKSRGLAWTFGAAVLADTALHLGREERDAAVDLLAPYAGLVLVPPFVPAAIFGPTDVLLMRLWLGSGDENRAEHHRMRAEQLCARAGLVGWL